jgi:hypothetical protein
MTKHEVSRKRTLAQRNDMSESSCEQKGRQSMKFREREGWLSEQRYVSGWSNVANSAGGANVGG